jgi:hypothetical protein
MQPDQFVLRLPPGMRDRIKVSAVLNRRSMNAEIIHYIDQSLTEKVGAAEGASSPRREPNQPLEVKSNG